MGKKLIIKGADFSQNAIITDDKMLYDAINSSSAFSACYGLVKSGNTLLQKSSDAARCCIFNFSLADYATLGYNHLKLYAKDNITVGGVVTKLDLILVIGSTSDYKIYNKNGEVTTWSWSTNASSIEGDLYGSNKLFVNIKYHNSSDFASTIKFEDLFSRVELSVNETNE